MRLVYLGQKERERAAATVLGGHLQLSPQQCCKVATEVKAQPGTLEASSVEWFELRECFKEPLPVFGLDPDPGIHHADRYRWPIVPGCPSHVDPNGAYLGVFDCVVG